MRFHCFLLLVVPVVAQTKLPLKTDSIIVDPSFTSRTSPEEWRRFERELQEAASHSHPPALSIEDQNSVALAKLAGSNVIRIRIRNAGPSLRHPEEPVLVTAREEIEKVWNGVVWEASTYPGWSEYSVWNVYAAVDYSDGRHGILLTDGWHIAIKTASGQIWFTRLAPLPQNQ